MRKPSLVFIFLSAYLTEILSKRKCELEEHATTAFLRVCTSSYQKEKGHLTAIWSIDLIHK